MHFLALYGGVEAGEPVVIVIVRPGQGAHKQLIVQTVWQAPKGDIVTDRALAQAYSDASRHLMDEVKATKVKLDNQVDAVKTSIEEAGEQGQESLIGLEMKLLDLEEEEVKLEEDRKAVVRMRTKRSRALANQAGAKKRARDEKEKKRILRNMAKARKAKKK